MPSQPAVATQRALQLSTLTSLYQVSLPQQGLHWAP